VVEGDVYPNASRREFFGALIRSIPPILFMRGNLRADDPAANENKNPPTDQDAVYEPGGDVKPPKLVHYVEPAFSPSSKEAFVEGTVRITTVVTRDGDTTDLHVTRGLNAEEDRTAIEAVKQWKFQPGTKAGQPVKVRVNVEVTFHLL
jgi:TonB family protein